MNKRQSSANQMRPASDEQAPDPATTYERSNPANEAGMGKLHSTPLTPVNTADKIHRAVKNRHRPKK
jgi:hypothetical protein